MYRRRRPPKSPNCPTFSLVFLQILVSLSRENFSRIQSSHLPDNNMKKSGFLAAASVAAASATAISSSPSSSTAATNSDSQRSREKADWSRNTEKSTDCLEKFAPRFDGLRFIETLVTAHR